MHPADRDRFWNRLAIASCALLAFGVLGPAWLFCFRYDHAHVACALSINRNSQTDDWRHFVLTWEAARVALVDFHQFPSWDPYHCGGIVLYQDPQTPFPGPLFFLSVLGLPSVATMKLWIYVHLLTGALGARALARSRGANIPEQLLAATIVTASSSITVRIGGGHFSFLAFQFLPYLLLAQSRAASNPRASVVVAGLLALTVYEGGTYPLPLMSIALTVDAVARFLRPHLRRGIARHCVTVAVLFPLLSAARLLPVAAFLRTHPRVTPLDDRLSLRDILASWLARSHPWENPPHPYVWGEYTNYIGPVVFALLLAGLCLAVVNRARGAGERRIDAAIFVFLIACAFGAVSSYAPYSLLHHLPLFRSLRVPARFLGVANVPLALLAVSALRSLRERLATHARSAHVFELFVLAIVAADLLLVSIPNSQMGMDLPLARRAASDAFRQTPSADYDRVGTFPTTATGTPTCYTPLQWTVAPGTGSMPENFAVAPANPHALRVERWSPNEVRFAVDTELQRVAVLNQNWDSGWQATGVHLVSIGGLVGFRLVPGQYRVVLRHRPPLLGLGLAVSLIGLVLAVVHWRRHRPDVS